MGVKVKICGIKTVEILEAVIAAGADYAGLVFFPQSPRYVDFDTAADLTDAARGRINTVALFVDPTEEEIDAAIAAINPDYIQLHGGEKPVDVRAIRDWSGIPVIKAVSVSNEADALAGLAYRGVADLILYDARPAPAAMLPGGNGTTFDWRALDPVKPETRFILSGGLNPNNVQAAITATGAWGVDVSSGVEMSRGVKDPELIRRFVHAAKTAVLEEAGA
jgi:phosphoribosylanthranilate isomerase